MVQYGIVRPRATVSVRKGSFFESSHLLLTKLTDLTYFWSMEMSNNHVEQSNISLNSAVSFLCLKYL